MGVWILQAHSPSPAGRDQRGAALVVALLTSAVTFCLGLSILVIAEMEELQSKAFAERARSRAAAEGALRLAASWFSTPQRVVGLPGPDEWVLGLRRGDRNLDGLPDDSCDGSLDEGRWHGFPLEPAPADLSLAELVRQACGDAETPDLLLVGGPALEAIAARLGRDVVVERLAIFGGPPVGGGRTSLTVEARVGVRRGAIVTSRVTATGRIEALPGMGGHEVLAAGGNIRLHPGALVAWGAVHAGGDLLLPTLDGEGALRSGLPRNASGGPLGWATGGLTDWNGSTREREYVLTELIGRTIQGEIVLSPDVVAPELPDPWLTLAAEGSVIVDGRRAGAPGAPQPWAYDPRVTTLQDDLSFLFASAPMADPLLHGSLERLAEAMRGSSGGGAGLRRFVLEPGHPGEPRWTENGAGPSRSAQEWIDSFGGEPVAAAFLAGAAEPPARLTLRTARGVVLAQAGTLVLRPLGEARSVTVNMPGEPFLDHGIDADQDGELDEETIGNGRWDHDFDADGVADSREAEGWELMPDLGPRYWVPYRDEDPARRSLRAHESFLNLAYPTDMLPGPVRVAFRAEVDGTPALVEEPADGEAGEGVRTTLGRDARGALVKVPAHAHALIANLSGDVIVEDGYQMVGALRARGGIVLGRSVAVRFDERLAREGQLAMALPQATLSGLAFPRQGIGAGRPGAPDAEPPPDASEGGRGGPGGDADEPAPGRDRPRPEPGGPSMSDGGSNGGMRARRDRN